MLRREFLRKEINRRLSRRLGVTLTIELVLGFLLSTGVIVLFAKIVEDVVEGESRRFDNAVLLWIHANSPDWLAGPMHVVTALGYYWVVLPLLAVAVYVFHREGAMISAALLVLATAGSAALSTTLKSVVGTLTLLAAWRLEGLWRWAVAVTGVAIVLLIGFSRLYLGVHYPTDVLAGVLASLLWVSFIGVCYFLWRMFRRRPSGKIEYED